MKSYVYEIVYYIIYIWKISINHICFRRVPRIQMCHIPVISVFQKRYIWINLVCPKLKKCIWYIPCIFFLCHMPCLSISYPPSPCHKFVMLSGSGPPLQMNLDSAGNCFAIRVLHTTAQRSSSTTRCICLRRACGLLLCPRPWVGTPPPARAPARRQTPPARGPPARGPPVIKPRIAGQKAIRLNTTWYLSKSASGNNGNCAVRLRVDFRVQTRINLISKSALIIPD